MSSSNRGYLVMVVVGTACVVIGAALAWGWPGGVLGFGASILLIAHGEVSL